MLSVILRFVYVLSLALWIGSIVFFSFLAAPSIFRVLPREAAGTVVAAILPKYYWEGIICGVLCLATSLVLGVRNRWSVLLIVRVVLLGLMLVAVLYAVVSLQPKIQAVKAQISTVAGLSPTDPLHVEFGRLHQRSVGINSAVLLLGIAVVFITAFTMKI